MARKKYQWSREGEDAKGELYFVDKASRSEQKRAVKRVDTLVKDLLGLPPDQITRLSLSDTVRDALDEAKRLQAKGRVRGGMRRQLLFVAGVLRNEDDEVLEGLFKALERLTR